MREKTIIIQQTDRKDLNKHKIIDTFTEKMFLSDVWLTKLTFYKQKGAFYFQSISHSFPS